MSSPFSSAMPPLMKNGQGPVCERWRSPSTWVKWRILRKAGARLSGNVEPLHQLIGIMLDAFYGRRRKRPIRRNMVVVQNNPQPGAIDLIIPGTDRTGHLRNFHGMNFRGRQVKVGDL